MKPETKKAEEKMQKALAALNSNFNTIRAGRGIGMTPLQIFTMVRFPVATPMILSGIRLAIVSALGIAATGVFIGAGGLGMLIWRGIQTRNTVMMLSGAIPVSLLAVLFEYAIGFAEKKLTKKTVHTGGIR